MLVSTPFAVASAEGANVRIGYLFVRRRRGDSLPVDCRWKTSFKISVQMSAWVEANLYYFLGSKSFALRCLIG